MRIGLAPRALCRHAQLRPFLYRAAQLGFLALQQLVKPLLFRLEPCDSRLPLREAVLEHPELDRRLHGLLLVLAVPARQHRPQLNAQLFPQLAVPARLGRLPLQRVHLPLDFFQNVVHPRQILLR